MKNSDIFVSQHNQASYGESGCGVACMMMLLKHINFRPLPKWEELCVALCLEKDPVHKGYQDTDPASGLYPEDLFRYVIQKNLHFRMHFFDDEWQKSLTIAPIMVLLDGVLDEFPQEAHWVVLTKLSEDYFLYLDPWEKTFEAALKKISFERLQQIYGGIACQLLDTELRNPFRKGIKEKGEIKEDLLPC